MANGPTGCEDSQVALGRCARDACRVLLCNDANVLSSLSPFLCRRCDAVWRRERLCPAGRESHLTSVKGRLVHKNVKRGGDARVILTRPRRQATLERVWGGPRGRDARKANKGRTSPRFSCSGSSRVYLGSSDCETKVLLDSSRVGLYGRSRAACFGADGKGRLTPLSLRQREKSAQSLPLALLETHKVQFYAVDHSARASMKSAASCVN